MFNPISTYRIQFNKEFTLADLERIIPYLQKLGVSTVYASPIFQAVPGSAHGYDGVDPNTVNPEIGTEEQLKTISESLRAEGINWIQDIVPNHMAFHQNNSRLTDVLEKGSLSLYKSFFDITLASDFFEGKLMVPFLGSSLEEVIQNNELKLDYLNNRFIFNYYDSTYPLSPKSYQTILEAAAEQGSESFRSLLEQLDDIKHVAEPEIYSGMWNEFLIRLAALFKDEKSEFLLRQRLEQINQNPELIANLASEQVYRLCEWQETDKLINYRRFFTVNGLICINIQDEKVFGEYHQAIKSLYDRGVFQGLRIDHIDGLYNPSKYLEDLRELVGPEAFIAVEKILEPGEELPATWPVQGTTGYDFLADVNNLFTCRDNKKAFTKYYEKLIGNDVSVEEQAREKKSHILYSHMQGELDNLYRLFIESSLVESENLNNIPEEKLKKAIGHFLINCPIYRYYGNRFPLPQAEVDAIKSILKKIVKVDPELEEPVRLLKLALLKRPLEGDAEYNQRALHFYMRCMQFSGPLMAKGVEDTLMYTYSRFIGHNDVGDPPEMFGLSKNEFNRKMLDRQKNWPLAINSTSTHDTKRGEDSRARLNIITEMPEKWFEAVNKWREYSRQLKTDNLPDDNDEYFIYQALLGSFPMIYRDEPSFKDRFLKYLEKAFREAKKHTNWIEPGEEYENAVRVFVEGLLDENGKFFKSFTEFLCEINDFAIINSLSQVLLKFTCPGVPDVYQGCELWDLSLVDPDNRRAVNFEQRETWLRGFATETDQVELLQQLWGERLSGKIKLWLTALLMGIRKESVEVFTKGKYIPLEVKGKLRKHVFAFARQYKNTWIVSVVPLQVSLLQEGDRGKQLKLKWKDTRIVLPPGASESWKNLVTGAEGKAGSEISLKEVLSNFPVGLLKLEKPESSRSAGILLSITSLPSKFGAGDFGTEAYNFADFLSRSNQKYWQLLPLNPTEKVNAYSPYSSYSSMAGNTVLISPELLVVEGWVEEDNLKQLEIKDSNTTDFDTAEKIRADILSKAYQTFSTRSSDKRPAFESFVQKENYWLQDFALYAVLKKHFAKPWYEWPQEYKLREPAALRDFAEKHLARLEEAQFNQFIFFGQWQKLRDYCNSAGIKLLGDLPFYIDYDSADVWANPGIFNLDAERNIRGVAGVPPDYFSEDGQLWGMPTFNWSELKAQNYDWWLKRIKKNLELYDEVRLDHFRAFADFWEVQAGEETAKNGVWKPGPGKEFFEFLKTELGLLPFVAEDLGDINDAVYRLRDQFELPGMKVLQFAFGDDTPQSTNIPHNYTPNFIAYTGTHDNNTVVGWFKEDVGKVGRKHLTDYLDRKPKEKNVHNELAKLTYASVAKTVILPIQDVLGLDEKARMNLPGSIEKNWTWKLQKNQLSKDVEKWLRSLVKVYNR